MTGRTTIDILLATYDGEGYLNAQIDSLLAQTYQDWKLIVRDDGSHDRTVEIIKDYQARYPDKITFIEDGDRNLGVSLNFNRLLEHAGADYMMFCDQDDVWLPKKIKITLDNMKILERTYGQGQPLLVHTDAKVVDASLQVIDQSFWRYQRSNPRRGSTLKRLLLQNVATGCTVMINKALRDMALPIPPEAMVHDWWLALVVAAFGHSSHISEPTLLYRQHERNDIGAKRWNFMVALRQITDLRNRKTILRNNENVTLRLQRQADAFLNRYRNLLSNEDKEMIARYSRLSELTFFVRKYYVLKHGFFYTDLLRNIGRLLLR